MHAQIKLVLSSITNAKQKECIATTFEIQNIFACLNFVLTFAFSFLFCAKSLSLYQQVNIEHPSKSEGSLIFIALFLLYIIHLKHVLVAKKQILTHYVVSMIEVFF